MSVTGRLTAAIRYRATNLALIKSRVALSSFMQIRGVGVNVAEQAYPHRIEARGQGRVRYNQSRTRSSASTNSANISSACPKTNTGTAYRPRPTPSTNRKLTTMATSPKDKTAAPTTEPTATTETNDKKKPNMEVEVKLRLPDAPTHTAVAALLAPSFRIAHDQENHFFDGSKKELSSQHSVMRVRIYNKDKKAVLTIKGKQILENGIGRSTEEEEPLDPVLARSFLSDPAALLELDTPLVKKIKEEYQLTGLVHLGGFSNFRQEYEWRGYTLELDETSYPWGTLYELECESDKPEEVKQQLETVFEKHNIGYSYSSKSKFANFVERTLE